jgi:alkylhydroperoxidase family enzyme
VLLEEAKAYVRATHELTEEQYRELESRLDYLKEAAERMPRVDWRNAFVGALLGAVVQAVLPPEPVRDAMNVVLRGLSGIFGGRPPELPS